MARITADGTTFEAEDGTRLVNALEDNGVDVSHRCGGNAKCTTCRVVFTAGEPDTMTRAEFDKLGDDRSDHRLSCQITCGGEMAMDVPMKVSAMDWDDAGGRPDDTVQPSTETFAIEALAAETD